MPTRGKLASLCLTSLLVVFHLAVYVQAQHRPRFATRPVNIYLPSVNGKGPADVSELVPVQRRVSKLTPARGSIEALFSGPTEEEKSRGLRALRTDDLRIKELIISDGVARLSLVSDCTACPATAQLQLKEAVELTLKQFDTVRRVKVIFNGKEVMRH